MRWACNRPGDVLDLLLAHVLEREGQLVAYLVAHHAADADATGLRQGLVSRAATLTPSPKMSPPSMMMSAKIDANAKLDARCGPATSALRSAISR